MCRDTISFASGAIAATASSSDSSINSPSPRGCNSKPSAVDSAAFRRSRDSSLSAGL